MSQTYEQAGRGVVALVTDAIRRWHPVLEQCGVTVAVLFIDDIDKESGESRRVLKCHGYPAAATVAITPLKQRVLGLADAVMVLDSATWHNLSGDEQLALVDHELHHLQVRVVAGRGTVGLSASGGLDRSARLDDHGRPALKLRKHDWQLGGFSAVAKRHRSAALEVQAARRFQEPGGQYCWDFDLLGAAGDLLDKRQRIDTAIDDRQVSLHLDGEPNIQLGTVAEVMARTAEHAES